MRKEGGNMTYTTIQGDTWDVVAFKTLGNEMLMSRILEANIEYADITVFGAGVTLVIPEIEAAPSELLPPWKR